MENITNKEHFLSFVQQNNPNISIDLIAKAYDFCKTYHTGQYRKSGEEYYTHPVAVASILASMNMDDVTIIVGLLHDVIEDTTATKEDIEREFSKEIANIVDGVTKLEKIKFREEQIRQVENFRKLFLALSKDIRVLIVKLVDRLHNMRTISHHDNKEKIKKIAIETIEIYAPLAERVGLQNIKNELQDICFAILHPETRNTIIKRVGELKSDFNCENVVKEIIKDIQVALDKYNIKGEIIGREKSPFSIWKQMHERNLSFDELSDIVAFRVVVKEDYECYNALAAIHLTYHAIPNRFKDYISTPKINNYQSLHTVIMGPKSHLVEVQIRTQRMHTEAEFGLASHWRYKQTLSHKETENILKLKASWIQKVLKILENSQHLPTEELMTITKTEITESQLVVFTENGEIINLPQTATILDFAFAVDEERALNFKHATIDGAIYEINHQIKNGDKIKIVFDEKKQIEYKWLNHIVTGKARNAILRYINQKNDNTKNN
jgi:guanosine-3',5'-bis(diphosphate) 3'-pyrophosphohydrolase